MNRQQAIDRVVTLVFRLSDELEKIEDANPNDLWPLHPDREPTEPFIPSRPYLDEIFNIVKSINGEELSDEVILSKLLYGAASIRIQLKISDSELEERAKRAASDLVDYHATRDVDVPLVSLEIGDEPFKLGPVSLHPIMPEDKKTDWWLRAQSTLGDMTDSLLLSYARVKVPGDFHKSIDHASNLVNESILLLRGIGFPITAKDRHQLGILNEYPLWKNIPYRLGDPTETTHVDARSHLVTAIGPFRFPYKLHSDILSVAKPDQISAMLVLLEKFGFSPKTDIPARIVSGFRWLGEATKPDALAARYVKVAFSLEAFIGGEAKDDLLSTRGITATLAERAAFLLSSKYEIRTKVDKDIKRHYRKRSGISHGRIGLVDPDEFEQFGELVRDLCWALLGKLNQFSTIDNLQSWVISQRYASGDDASLD